MRSCNSPNLFLFRNQLSRQCCNNIIGCCYVPSKDLVFSSFTISLFNSAHEYAEYLVIEQICVANHTAKYCSSSHCRCHILCIGKKALKHMFDKLNEIQFNCQFVDCFFTVFKVLFKEREREKKEKERETESTRKG